MFSRNREENVNETRETRERHTANDGVPGRTATVARGGLSLWSILTGVLVAFGVMFLLSAIVGAIIVNTGIEDQIADGTVAEVGIGAIIALAVAQFLSYMWGGYTAGRMARGSGLANGILVPIAALVIAALAAGITYALGETTSLGLPFAENRLPTTNDALIDLGIAGGIATLVAMLLGGLLGGLLGARWHTKLERDALAEHDARTIDIREGRTTTHDEPAGRDREHAYTTGARHDDDASKTAADPATDPAAEREPIHTRPARETHTR